MKGQFCFFVWLALRSRQKKSRMQFFSRENLFEQENDKATKNRKKSNVRNTYHTIFIYGIA